MDECPRCYADSSFVLNDGKYSCRVCKFVDTRRAEYEMDDECNFIDFTKDNKTMFTELRRSVKKSKLRKTVEGTKKSYYRPIAEDEQIPRVSIMRRAKKFKRRVQPGEKDPPGDVLPRRHFEVEVWKRVTHRLSTFTQLLARTTRFLVKEKRAGENVKPVAMVIFRRLLASQGIAFSDREWTEVEEDRYSREMRRYNYKSEVVATVAEQQEQMSNYLAHQNEGLQTGAGLGENEMWSMLMSETVTEHLQVQAPVASQGVRMKKVKRHYNETEMITTETETSIDALVRGGILTLNIELLVAIAFLACSLVGSRVHMADLVRWFREGRVALPPHFLHDLVKIKHCDDGRQIQLESCRFEAHFHFYLHECHSFLQRVISATRVPRRRLSIRLDEVIAAHLSHLNLPFALMERALVVLARSRVDTVDLSIDRADEEGQYCNENTCRFGMEEGRVHPMLSTSYRSPFVTFSPDTRAMAVILLVLRLTFGLRDDRAFDVKTSSRFFNAGAWLRQLRMRLRVYGGEEGATVVEESIRESARDYEVEWGMQLNRTDLVQHYGKLMYRQRPRAAFPEGWTPLPQLDGDRYLYKDSHPFPEDGERTRASPSRIAMMTPLLFHGDRVREEAEKGGKERQKHGEWREAVKLIGVSFKDLEIEEASESLRSFSPSMRREKLEEDEGEVAEEWKHLFPAAVNFEISLLPRLSVTSLVKFNNRKEGRYMIGGGSGDISFSLVAAAPNLSRPHRFLIQAMSRLIVEAPAVIYAASSMLERRMLRYQSCLSLVQNLESGGAAVVEGCAIRYDRRGRLTEARLALKRAPGQARNIIDVECHNLTPARGTVKKKNKKKRADDERNEIPPVGDNEAEEEEGDQRSANEREEEEEAESAEESLVDEEIEEEEEADGNDDLGSADSMAESGGEEGGEEDEEGEEEVETRSAERPCERYKRAMDKYNTKVQRKYFLNFEYLWSILAMRLW